MRNSTVNFSTSGASSNSTSPYFGLQYILDIFNFLFGVPTHSYVIWLIKTGTGSGVASEFFTLNLSVCEVVFSLNAVLSIHGCCVWDLNFKRLTRFLLGLAVTGRPLFQCLMCVERYLAVVHPVTFLKCKPLRYRVICCTVAWIIILGSSLGCMFTAGLFYIYTWFYSLQFLLFFFIQMFFLVAVLRALKQSGPGERGREENPVKRKAFCLILITTVSMTITYVPFIMTGLFYILTKYYNEELFCVGLLCFILSGFFQPVLYLNRVGKISCLCFQ